MSESLCFTPIHVLHQWYRSGAVSPAEVMAAGLAQTDKLDGHLGAYLARYAEEAQDSAEAATAAFANQTAVGPLAGIPIALKDLIDLKGRVTTGGSPERIDRMPQETAVIADRLFSAGAICPGKTATTEMAAGGWGTNEHFGTPKNPWDMDVHRVPGGSSAGSGVAVAAGYVPGAIGTDTGGSVRLPAAFCGIVGLKVTEGVLPNDGIIPLSSTLDTPGPLTRSVIDAALLFDVMRGTPPTDVDQAFEAGVGLYGEIDRGLDGVRLGVPPDAWFEGYDPEVLEAFAQSVLTLKELGAAIVTYGDLSIFRGCVAKSGVIATTEGYFFNREIVDKPNAVMDQAVRARLLDGKGVSATTYLKALADRRRDQVTFLAAAAGIDALLTPTTLHPAIPVQQVNETVTPATTTRVGNYLGLCGLAIPNGFSKDGLPISLQILCKPGQEAMALRIGRAFEKETDFLDRRPV